MLFFCVFLGLYGCYESDLDDLDLPVVEPKLVVVSFISPEKTGLEVYVSKSIPIFGTDSVGFPEPLLHAEVLFWNGTEWFEIPYDPDKSTYRDSTIQILPGQTYKLQVTSEEGLKAEATCTVPTKMNTAVSGRIDSSTTQPENTEPDYLIEATWQDLPGTGDYYRIGFFQKVPNFDPTREDSLLFPLGTLSAPYARDFQADGRLFRVSSNTIPSYRESRQLDMLHFSIHLLTTDRHYYEYHRTLNRYAFNISNNDPVKVYSNVQGGLGVFAAYREYRFNFSP